jgi:hypothetical protein
MAGTKGFDETKDKLLVDYGVRDLPSGQAIRLQVKSYDGAEPKLEILKMVRRKNGEYTPAKGIRLSLEEAHAVLELVTDETFEWNDLDEVPTRKRTKTTK